MGGPGNFVSSRLRNGGDDPGRRLCAGCGNSGGPPEPARLAWFIHSTRTKLSPCGRECDTHPPSRATTRRPNGFPYLSTPIPASTTRLHSSWLSPPPATRSSAPPSTPSPSARLLPHHTRSTTPQHTTA